MQDKWSNEQQYPPPPEPKKSFQWPKDKPIAHLPGNEFHAPRPGLQGRMSDEVQTPSQNLKFDPNTMKAPNVLVVDNNLTQGYSDDYNDDRDQ